MKRMLACLLALAMLFGVCNAVAESDDRVTISVAIFDRGNVPADQGNYEDNWVTKWINENAPVKVNFVPVPRWETYQTYSLWLASGTCADVIMEFQPSYVQEWSGEGVLIDLKPYIDEYGANYRALTPESVQAWGQYNGGEYAMVDARMETSIINHMCYIRTDWLENLGLEMPSNFDELKEVIRAFTEDDPDQNGVNDTWGWSMALQGQSLIQNMLGVHGGLWVVNDDQFVSGYVSEEMVEAYEFLEEIYDNGWCDIEYLSDTNGTNAYSQFSTGKLGIICCGMGYLTGTIWDTLIANEPDAKVAAMPSVGEYGYFQERECNLLMMVPTTCEHPEAVVEYLDWMLAEGWQTVKYGVEGVDFEYDGDLIVRLNSEGYESADAKYTALFNYTQEYALLSTYKETVDMYRTIYEAYDDSNPKKAAYLIQADAMDATKDIKFNRPTPTEDLGLAIYSDLMPDMETIASEYWAKALNDKDYTAAEALEAIKAEWAGMGYESVKEAFNARAEELGYID